MIVLPSGLPGRNQEATLLPQLASSPSSYGSTNCGASIEPYSLMWKKVENIGNDCFRCRMREASGNSGGIIQRYCSGPHAT